MTYLRPESIQGTLERKNGDAANNPVPKAEQPWWQHAARYAALGMTREGIAQAVGQSYVAVVEAMRQPAFQERITRIMAEMDVDVMEVFKKAAVAAAVRVVNLAQDAKSEVVKLAANKEILDRRLGKAIQYVETDATIRSGDPVAEAEALRAEIASMAAQRDFVASGAN